MSSDHGTVCAGMLKAFGFAAALLWVCGQDSLFPFWIVYFNQVGLYQTTLEESCLLLALTHVGQGDRNAEEIHIRCPDSNGPLLRIRINMMRCVSTCRLPD